MWQNEEKNIDGVLLWCEEVVTFLGGMWLQASFMPGTFSGDLQRHLKLWSHTLSVFRACTCSQAENFYLQMEDGKCFSFGL